MISLPRFESNMGLASPGNLKNMLFRVHEHPSELDILLICEHIKSVRIMCNCTVHKLRYAHWAGRQWQLWMGERSCDSVHGCTLPSRLLPRQNQINFCQWG